MGFDQGLPLAFEVGGLLGLPLGEILVGGTVDLKKLIESKVVDGNTVNYAKLVEALAGFLGRAAQHDTVSLIKRLLVAAHTRRSRIAQGEEIWDDFAKHPELTDSVYKANYLEAIRVAAKIIQEHWIPLSRGPSGSGSVLAALTGLLDDFGSMLQGSSPAEPPAEPPAEEPS